MLSTTIDDFMSKGEVMSQENPSYIETVISFFGTKRKTGQEDFFSNINRWHLLPVQDKSGRTTVNIPL